MMTNLAATPGAGLVVMPDIFTSVHRADIYDPAAQLRLPVIYPYSYMCRDGGLASYGIDQMDMFRRSATYVDRILRGARPAEMPVQAPEKFEFVINLKTAKAMGLSVPEGVLARADEVIE
jgi:putative ABC transport system substrate-binding protein